MNQWNRLGVVLALGALLGSSACKKAEDKGGEAKPPKAAKSTDKAKKKPVAKKAEAKKDVGQAYLDCVAAYNAKDAAKFKACYPDGSTHALMDSGMETKGGEATLAQVQGHWKAYSDGKWDAQLVLVNGNNVAALVVGHGTNDGPMKLPDGSEIPAGNKKMGGLAVQAVEFDDAGKIKNDRIYWDIGVEMKQMSGDKAARAPLAPWVTKAEVVVASDSDVEKANLETVTKLFAAFSAGKYDEMHALEAEDIEVLDQSAPELLKGLDARKAQIKGYATAFPGLVAESPVHWAAGDYVVTEMTLSGTNKGPLPGLDKGTGKDVSLKASEVRKLKDGKVTHEWLVLNSMAMAAQLGLLPPKKEEGKK